MWPSQNLSKVATLAALLVVLNFHIFFLSRDGDGKHEQDEEEEDGELGGDWGRRLGGWCRREEGQDWDVHQEGLTKGEAVKVTYFH